MRPLASKKNYKVSLKENKMSKKMLVTVLMIAVAMFVLTACGKNKPVTNEGLIVRIDGSGSQGSYGDVVHGRKIIVRDDLKPNKDGWYTREVYEVTNLSDLGIASTFAADFQIEYERDYSQKNKAFVGYFSMNVANTVERETIQKFLDTNPTIVATSVVNRLDGKKKFQECSLVGLQENAIRYVLYQGDGISYQLCDPNWTVSQ